MSIYATEVGKPDAVPEIEIIPLEDPVPRVNPVPVPQEPDPVPVPERRRELIPA